MSTYIRIDDQTLPKYEDSCFLLNEYLKHLVVIEGRSLKTANTYYVILRSFLRYVRMIAEELPEEEFDSIPITGITESMLRGITRKDITDYMAFLAFYKGNKEKARKDKLTTLRSFYSYLVDQRDFDENPALYVKFPKVPQREAKYLQKDEVSLLLQAAAHQANPERDYCITILFLTCGLRLSELCGLDVDSFKENGTFRVIGKGNKERTAYLGQKAQIALNEWLDIRAGYGLDEDEKALFVSNRTKKRLTGRGIEKIIEKELATSGLSGQGYSVHKLRHTAATMMYEGGAGLMELKEILGHQHTTTTEIYTHINNKRLRGISDSINQIISNPPDVE